MTTKHPDSRDVPESLEAVPGLRAPIATERGLVDTPGALRSEVWLTLQTRQAQQVFTGRKATTEKPYILGLTRFGAILSQLQVCVDADDPYADWWLIKVEEALRQAAREVKVLRQRVEQQLSSTPGMEVKTRSPNRCTPSACRLSSATLSRIPRRASLRTSIRSSAPS